MLASVPGTTQAVEAVLLAQVPQTARVNKKQLQAPDVAYQGAAEFSRSRGRKVQRAVNTDKDVFQVGDTYYLCYQGVWFTAKAATGPWAGRHHRPAQIYQIPASSPAHHVTYVVVEDDNAERRVGDVRVCGRLHGPDGRLGLRGVGHRAGTTRPTCYYGGLYPIYYPYFPTYGYSAWYNPWTGTYGRSAVAYGPYGGMGAGHATTRAPAPTRAARWRGDRTARRGAAQAWNPRTGTYAQTRQGSNIYGSWGSSYVQRGDDWAADLSRHQSRHRQHDARDPHRSGRGDQPQHAGAGRQLRRRRRRRQRLRRSRRQRLSRQDGSWQKYENGSWGSVSAARSRPGGTQPPARERTRRRSGPSDSAT